MNESEKIIQLQQELKPYEKAIGKAIDQMLDNELTKYPIFVVHQHQVEIGVEIISREKVAGNWSVNASTLEDFVGKQIIFPDKIEDFKQIYKNPEEYICFFILSELGAQFMWMPRSASPD